MVRKVVSGWIVCCGFRLDARAHSIPSPQKQTAKLCMPEPLAKLSTFPFS